MTEVKTSEALKMYSKVTNITIERDFGEDDIAIYINLYNGDIVLNSDEVFASEDENVIETKVKALVKKYKNKGYEVKDI